MHNNCKWKSQKKSSKALREYDRLLERIPGHQTHNNQKNVEKIYSRRSRLQEMNELYNIISMW